MKKRNDESEIWKWISGYEGLYQISSLGNLKSYLGDENGRVRSNINKTGWYFTVVLVDKLGRKKTFRIHRLVAEAFIGKIPKGYHVHHKDGNKQNNRVENLEIVHPAKHNQETRAMNPDFAKAMNDYNRYEKPKSIRQYTLDGHLIAEYVSATVASMMTGICQRNILQVANKTPYGEHHRVRKQAGGYYWEFGKGVIKDA